MPEKKEINYGFWLLLALVLTILITWIRYELSL